MKARGQMTCGHGQRVVLVMASVAGVRQIGLALMMCLLVGRSARGADPTGDEVAPTVWAHRPYVVQRAVTNRTAAARTVAKVTTSCACLKAKAVEGDGGGRGTTALPGVMPFELTLDPTGMEGLITKTASVTFDDGTVETMTVRVNVRTRVKLTPGDAAFGIVRTQRAASEIVARLTGCVVTNGGARIVAVIPPENPQFDVRMAADGLGVVVGSAPRADRFAAASPVDSRADRFAAASPVDSRADRVLAGAIAETWHVMTTDSEIPKIPFVVSAQFVDGLSVTPRVLTMDADRTGGVSRVVSLRRDDRCTFKVLSAETMPRKWGDVAISSQPLNGWRISIANIDPDEVRQFSKRPYLRITTDLKDVETIDIPLRVMTGGSQ